MVASGVSIRRVKSAKGVLQEVPKTSLDLASRGAVCCSAFGCRERNPADGTRPFSCMKFKHE